MGWTSHKEDDERNRDEGKESHKEDDKESEPDDSSSDDK